MLSLRDIPTLQKSLEYTAIVRLIFNIDGRQTSLTTEFPSVFNDVGSSEKKTCPGFFWDSHVPTSMTQ